VETEMTPEHDSWRLRFAKAMLVTAVIVVFYLLSTGPVWWLHKHGVISRSAFAVIYQPIGHMIEDSPEDFFYRYIAWWSSVIEL
jgi:hypothetical protein